MSSPWNALLESLHSAFIDELNARFPDEKPSLGLPIRQTGFAPPAKAKRLKIFSVLVGDGLPAGVAFLAVSESQADLDGVWAGLLARAEPEFKRRGIKPLLNQLDKDIPVCTSSVTRSVWIPIEIRGQWYLGIGI